MSTIPSQMCATKMNLRLQTFLLQAIWHTRCPSTKRMDYTLWKAGDKAQGSRRQVCVKSRTSAQNQELAKATSLVGELERNLAPQSKTVGVLAESVMALGEREKNAASLS